jgi:hypothetical protein
LLNVVIFVFGNRIKQRLNLKQPMVPVNKGSKVKLDLPYREVAAKSILSSTWLVPGTDVEFSGFHKLIDQVEGATLDDDDDGMEIDSETVDRGFAEKDGSDGIFPSLQVWVFSCCIGLDSLQG